MNVALYTGHGVAFSPWLTGAPVEDQLSPEWKTEQSRRKQSETLWLRNGCSGPNVFVVFCPDDVACTPGRRCREGTGHSFRRNHGRAGSSSAAPVITPGPSDFSRNRIHRAGANIGTKELERKLLTNHGSDPLERSEWSYVIRRQSSPVLSCRIVKK